MIDRSMREAVKQSEAEKLRELYELKKSADKQKGLTFTQRTIADLGDWTQPNVSSYLKGAVELKEESALIFSKALEVPVSAFSPRLAEKISQREMLARNPLLSKVTVSYVPKLNAEVLNKIRHNLRDQSFIMPNSSETTPICKELSRTAFSFELEDNSLEKYAPGTIFVVDPMVEPSPTDLVFVGNKNKDSDFHVREYCVTDVSEDGVESYELKASNPAYPTLKENYEVLGVVVAAVNMLKP